MKAISKTLTKVELESFGKELETLRSEIQSKIGQEDADYIRRIDAISRYNEILGRFFIHFSLDPATFGMGVGMLSIAKILNNMELGHNVLHGQYDWMNDPYLNSRTFQWDNVADSNQWKYSHNYMHHTFTNVIGKDHDLGYGVLRVSPEQEWKPYHLIQPIINVVLAMIFQFGIGNHGVNVKYAELPESERKQNLFGLIKEYWQKIEQNVARDYIFFPLLAGLGAPKVFAGNLLANTIRNLWTHTIIFCGHFTENSEMYPEEILENETKAGWYLRQLKGSSNLQGGKLFYALTGHLSHQIEHHMFPDIPANRYEEMAPRVQEICEKYGQHYNTGGFLKQFGEVWKRLFTNSLPNLSLSQA